MCSGLMNESASAEKRRQRHQHVAGKPSVRGVHADLTANLEPLAHDVREVVEDFRKVAAGLALNEDRGREEAHVEQRHALDRLFSDSLSGRPKFCSSNAFRNSGPTGSPSSSATIFMPALNAWPARMPRESRSSASGKISSNLYILPARLCRRTAAGRSSPTAKPIGHRPRLADRASWRRRPAATGNRQDMRNARAHAEARAGLFEPQLEATSPSTPDARRGRRSAAGPRTRVRSIEASPASAGA